MCSYFHCSCIKKTYETAISTNTLIDNVVVKSMLFDESPGEEILLFNIKIKYLVRILTEDE